MKSFITFLCTTKNGKSERLTIEKSEFMIGRGDDCTIRLPFSEVSRQHCRIRILPSHMVEFTDARVSSVGIMHNGKYKKNGVLTAGDELFIGDTRFVLMEFAGSVIVRDSKADRVDLSDEMREGLNQAESAMETALGVSLVSGHTPDETAPVISWADLTALSIESNAKLEKRIGQTEPGRGGANNTLILVAVAACLFFAVLAGGLAMLALRYKAEADAKTATPITMPSTPAQ